MPEAHWLMVRSQNQIKFWNNQSSYQSVEVHEVVSNYGEIGQRLISPDVLKKVKTRADYSS